MEQRNQLSLSLGFFALVLLCSACLACAQSGKQVDPPSSEWSGQMQNMGQNLVELYPYLMSSKEFDAPENRQKVQKYVTKMAEAAHGAKVEGKNVGLGRQVDMDPYMVVILNVLDHEIQLANEGLKTGKRDFARTVLKNSAAMCVRCHSRGQWGPEFVDWKKESSFQRLSPIEKGDLLMAVRHYDQAIKQYEEVLSDKQMANETEAWSRVGNSALNAAVRVKQDPQLAKRIVKTILSNPSLPEFQRRYAEEWLKSIADWEMDLKEQAKSPKKSSQNGLIMAQKVLDEARRKEDYYGDRGSYIQYLIASGLLHDFLRTESSDREQAQALLLLGRCYEVITEMGDGDANEFYYKACIKRDPHSKIAVRCYRHLEQNLNLDYIGNGGSIQFPTVAAEQLGVWRSMATPETKEPSSEGRRSFEGQ